MTIEAPRRVTIDDVARRANVHKATVSRALNAQTRHQVSRETVLRVMRAAEELGYVPNVMARGLRTSSSMTIGVVIPDITNPFFPPIVRGIESFLGGRGYTALLANTDGSAVLERAALQSLLSRRVDGLIVASGHHEHHSALADAYASGIRAVMVNRDAGPVPYPLVTGEDARGVGDAVAHLATLGHRRFLHIAGPADISTSSTRADAFTEHVSGVDGATACVVEAAALSVEAGQRAMEVVLAERGGLPTAIIAGNDLVALGVLRSLRARGLRCPEDVSVVGFNDIEFAQDFFPPLTTVRVPTTQMGAEAARLLLRNIERGAQDPVVIRLPVSLVVRGSTGPAPD